jgi:hypothetical protein
VVRVLAETLGSAASGRARKGSPSLGRPVAAPDPNRARRRPDRARIAVAGRGPPPLCVSRICGQRARRKPLRRRRSWRGGSRLCFQVASFVGTRSSGLLGAPAHATEGEQRASAQEWVGREGCGAGQLRCRRPENARGGQTAKCRCFCSNCWTAHSSDC